MCTCKHYWALVRVCIVPQHRSEDKLAIGSSLCLSEQEHLVQFCGSRLARPWAVGVSPLFLPLLHLLNCKHEILYLVYMNSQDLNLWSSAWCGIALPTEPSLQSLNKWSFNPFEMRDVCFASVSAVNRSLSIPKRKVYVRNQWLPHCTDQYTSLLQSS